MSTSLAQILSRLLVPLLGISFVCGGCRSRIADEEDTFASEEKVSEESEPRPKKKKKKKSNDDGTADEAYRDAIDAEADQDYTLADKHYRTALRNAPTHRRANQRYVHFLLDQNRLEDALQVAQEFFDEVPGEPVSAHTLADAQAANGNYKEMIGTMSGLLAFAEDDAAAFEKRGRARINIGDYSDGIRDIRRALKLDPDNTSFLLSLSGGLMRFGSQQAARKTLLRLLQIDSNSTRANLLLGILARNERNLRSAQKYHKRAVELDPEDARAHYELGITYNTRGNNREAEESLGRAVDLNPESGTYWYAYGDLLRLLKRDEEAAAAYRQSVILGPKNAMAWERLGETLLLTAQLPDAAKQLKRGIAKVDNPRLYFLLAKVYAEAKKDERAITALQDYLDKASSRAPDRRAAKRLLRRLSR